MSTTTNKQDNSSLFEAAYVGTAAVRAALVATELAPINLDAQSVINMVVSVMPKLKSLRPEIQALLPGALRRELSGAASRGSGERGTGDATTVPRS